MNPSTMFLAPTNQLEIENLITSLPNKLSSGHDQITNTLLKKLAPNISQPLAIIFNKISNGGNFSQCHEISRCGSFVQIKGKMLYHKLQAYLTTVDHF